LQEKERDKSAEELVRLALKQMAGGK